MNRGRHLVLIVLLTASVAAGLSQGGRLMAMQIEDAVARDADIILQAGILEPIALQVMSGSLTVTYKEKLDADSTTERAIPGIHAAMIDAAKAKGEAILGARLDVSRSAGRAALASALSAHQLARVAFLYGPFVRANAAITIAFRTGDTASSAASRALGGLKEDPGYQARLVQLSREPGMPSAMNKAAAIIRTYQTGVMTASAVAATGALAAARARANAYAAERGFEPVYSETVQ